jgi:hypothetical protein
MTVETLTKIKKDEGQSKNSLPTLHGNHTAYSGSCSSRYYSNGIQGILLIQICFIRTLAKYKFTYRSWIQAIPYEWILAGMLARFK